MTISAISVVQYAIGPLNSKEEFWRQVAEHLQQAINDGSKLVVFPEYLTGTLLALSPVLNHYEACQFIDSFTNEYITTFQQLSKETGITILGGTHITKEGDSFVNAAFLFFPDGRYVQQNKVHLTPEERARWNLKPGNGFSVYDTAIGRVGILTCYDIEFPESARALADMGADIILCPSFTDEAHGYYRVRLCSQARAIENQIFVALSGLVGYMPHIPQIDSGYCQAGIFAPCDYPFPADGILALGETNESMIATGKIDMEMLNENRERGQVFPAKDRRPEVYAKYASTTTVTES
ncbi:carbon-nitrogen hydrolase family protein [Aneurinibacillus migulanus]|uniref:carbon-nitrogen hydrolase family protein n=1 Tax=Aneurinibacillus migulanus TaxID=47500 RepID=UPI002E210996|nr:carbon-nitrogen hydrolase family protein [Aneurinibacillus migulanus]